MINFALENIEQCHLELEKYRLLEQQLHNVKIIMLCLLVTQVVEKWPEIESVRVYHVKKEYNDEGLDAGIYFDYKTKDCAIDFCELGDPDFNSLYRYKVEGNKASTHHILAALKELGVSRSEHQAIGEKIQKYIPAINELNSIYQMSDLSADFFEELWGVELGADLNSNMKTVLSKDVYEHWRVSVERAHIDSKLATSDVLSRSLNKKI